jgi:tyrosine decarboxylase
MEPTNTEALFLGPFSENRQFFKDMLSFLIDEHIFWRRNFHPEDPPIITLSDQNETSFIASQQKIQEALLELSAKLKTSSVPWHSPRYLGHMNTDVLMPAVLAYMATILYNPNNCAIEGSPVTTELELEAAQDLCKMMGYDPKKSWGHLTAGGTTANFEALWVARNLKSIPLAVKKVMPKLVGNLSDWELQNFSTEEAIDLMKKIPDDKMDNVFDLSVRGKGSCSKVGKVLIPQSRHYSWDKAVDLLGIGHENIIHVKVKDNYRMDIEDLKFKIKNLYKNKIPILAVIGIVGTTEEGAVDLINEIVDFKNKIKEELNYSFFLHVDAAYGGYLRSVFLDEKNRFMEYNELRDKLIKNKYINDENTWPSREVYTSLMAISDADSISIDPHKLGYVPYLAAAVLFRYKELRKVISFFASYIESKKEIEDGKTLGSYDLMGSKSGAMAAAVWTAQKVVPLNFYGYGKIIAHSIEGARHFNYVMSHNNIFTLRGKEIQVQTLTMPDCNIVVFAFNILSNKSLVAMNKLNEKIYEYSSYESGPVYKNDFITSKTILKYSEYGDAPINFIKKFGLDEDEWHKNHEVYVLRACVLTPYLGIIKNFNKHIDNIINAINKNIEKAMQDF